MIKQSYSDSDRMEAMNVAYDFKDYHEKVKDAFSHMSNTEWVYTGAGALAGGLLGYLGYRFTKGKKNKKHKMPDGGKLALWLLGGGLVGGGIGYFTPDMLSPTQGFKGTKREEMRATEFVEPILTQLDTDKIPRDITTGERVRNALKPNWINVGAGMLPYSIGVVREATHNNEYHTGHLENIESGKFNRPYVVDPSETYKQQLAIRNDLEANALHPFDKNGTQVFSLPTVPKRGQKAAGIRQYPLTPAGRTQAMNDIRTGVVTATAGQIYAIDPATRTADLNRGQTGIKVWNMFGAPAVRNVGKMIGAYLIGSGINLTRDYMTNGFTPEERKAYDNNAKAEAIRNSLF